MAGGLGLGPRSFETGKWCFVLLMHSHGFELESSQVSPDSRFWAGLGWGQGLARPRITEAFPGEGGLWWGRVCCPESALLVAGAPNEGNGCSEAFPRSPLGSRRRSPLMSESLSQVGTNCHKVQNILVVWGACNLLTMPQPPWGGDEGSHSPDVGVGFFLSFFHAHRPSTEWETHYTTHTHTHTHFTVTL